MDEITTSTHYAPLQPFDRLIGNWNLEHRDLNTKEEWAGNDTFEWLPGGHFLAFHHHEGGNAGLDGVMIIGNEMGWEETEPGEEIVGHGSRVVAVIITDIFWEIVDDTVQFWLNSKQSGMCFKGEFSEDGNSISGRWKWPGGGYDLVMQRVINEYGHN